MAGIAENWQKRLIFIVVPLLKFENIKEKDILKKKNRWKKIERYIQIIKNKYKLKWLSPYSFH